MAEDFEFKPITEGLGFHKKVIDINEEIEVIEPPPRRAPSEMPAPRYTDKSLPRSMPSSTPQVTQAIQNAAMAAAANSDLVGTSPAWKPLISPTLGYETKKTVSPAIPKALSYKPAYYNVGTAFFDFLMVMGLTGIFGAVVFYVAKVEYISIWDLIQSELMAQVALGVLVFAVFELYVIISRVFFGATLGEWVLGLRMGHPQVQSKWWYPLAVAWRGFLIFATGFVTLPLLSLIFRSDLAGKLSGVSMLKETR